METYLRDPTFITGFFTGVVATILTAIVAGRIAAIWNRLRQPFQPTVKPGRLPTEKGPSLVQELVSWFWSVMMLVAAIGILVLIVWMMMGGEGG